MNKKLNQPSSRQGLISQNILLFFLLSFSYVTIITPLFEKSIFPFLLQLSLLKTLTTIGLFSLATSLIFFIKTNFTRTIWFYVFNLQFQGSLIYYNFTPNTDISIVLQSFILLAIIALVDKVHLPNLRIPSFNIQKSFVYIVSLAIILMIPFLYIYGEHITLKNLMFQDIYRTRFIFRELKSPLLTYLQSPLSRVILPTILVYSLHKKKLPFIALSFIGIIYLFLCGATKSIFVGAIASILFFPGQRWTSKTTIFTLLICTLSLLGFVTLIFFENSFIFDAFIRRVFFVPPFLDNLYHQHFKEIPTFWQQSSVITKLFHLNADSSLDLTRYFGEKVMGIKGMNANIGVITEGFVSWGYLGVLVHSVFYAIVILILKHLRISKIFFGIIFSYLFYFNTSLITTLTFTHGLLFLLVFYMIFLRNTNKSM